MRRMVSEGRLGVEYIADAISSCDQNGLECIADDDSGDILYYDRKGRKYATDKMLNNGDTSIHECLKDRAELEHSFMDASGDGFKDFAIQWNALQKKPEGEVYKTKACDPIMGNFTESSSGCEYDARSLNERVAAWYAKAFPTDKEMVDEMRPYRATFQDVLAALESGKDVYEVIGAGDSIVRERVFEELSKLTGKDYEYFYDKWLSADDISVNGMEKDEIAGLYQEGHDGISAHKLADIIHSDGDFWNYGAWDFDSAALTKDDELELTMVRIRDCEPDSRGKWHSDDELETPEKVVKMVKDLWLRGTGWDVSKDDVRVYDKMWDVIPDQDGGWAEFTLTIRKG